MKTPDTNTPAAQQPEGQEVPDWVDDTPLEVEYSLTMYCHYGGGSQEVDISREEYIALKALLAAMRGYNVPTAEQAIQAVTESIAGGCFDGAYRTNKQQLASHLETARDFFRAMPGLVATRSELLDSQLKTLAE